MFGISKKIQDAMKKAETDPVGAMEDHKKSLNSGLTGLATRAFMGKGFVDKMNGVMDMGQTALAGQQERLKLIQTGLDGTADILSVQDTGATVNDSFDPWTAVAGMVTAFSICSTTFSPSTWAPSHWPVDGR